jgi:SCF-associated factor 1
MLTQYGDVFVWWPFSGQMETRIQSEMNGEGAGNTSSPRNRNGAIPCVPWELDLAPTRLPSIPALPDLSSGTNSEQPTQLIKVAGLDNLLIGLTNKGHVLAFESLHNETSASNGHWQYVNNYCFVNNSTADTKVAPKIQRGAHSAGTFSGTWNRTSSQHADDPCREKFLIFSV